MAALIFHSHQQWWTRIPFSPHRLQHLLSDPLMTAILTGMRWYLKGGLISISPMAGDVEDS